MGKPTTRLSLKTIAFMFPEHSLERVYLHGKWQRSRGRNPSLTLHNQRDPLMAFQTAEALVGEHFKDEFSQPFSRHDYHWVRYFYLKGLTRSHLARPKEMLDD
jgi:hypothetical protein